MQLYNLTLQQSEAITCSVLGNFSGIKSQEIVVAHTSVLELLRPDPSTGKIVSLLSHQVFGLIRSLAAFRLAGASKDYLVVGSDSGRIVILEYNPAKNTFDKVHQETYGKTGARRVVPGQYLAADPKGRAVMIGAIEKQKLAYILNRDSSLKLTISSPLEAHKTAIICHGIIGVDVGYENPIFASIEVDYSDADQDPTGEAAREAEKMLTYYELDLGLNHIVRKWTEKIDFSANHLIAIPGGDDGPSGVLVCSEGRITWKHMQKPSFCVPIPQRPDPLTSGIDPNGTTSTAVIPGTQNKVIVVSSVVHRLKRGFFVLAQTEVGDVFKITVECTADSSGNAGQVQAIKIKYFDTIPVAVNLSLLKSGFLFAASEFGNHYLYQIENLGDDDESQVEYSSVDFPQGDSLPDSDSMPVVAFIPRELRNLAPVDEMESLCPLIDAKVLNLTDENSPQIYALCGRGSRSTFRILRHGLDVSEMAVSELPGNPNAIWTVRRSVSDIYDSYIIISFINATLVLSIGETVEEVTDTGVLATTSTITVGQLGENALVQVYPQGIRYIRADKRVSEWKAPTNQSIVSAACNQRQVVVALSNNEIVYFELDVSGHLNEFQDRKEMSSRVLCLSLSPIPTGRLRARFLAIGCADLTVRILSLDPESCLHPLSMQALSAPPDSLAMIDMPDPTTGVSNLFLNIGLANGVLLKTCVDSGSGNMSDTRMRFLGSRGVKLFLLKIQGETGLLALSSRPWISFTYHSRSKLMPLSYESLEYGSSFCSEQCTEGIVAITGNTLRILNTEKLGSVFKQASIPLKYTPRRFIFDQVSQNFVVIESDHGVFCPSDRAKILETKATLDADEGTIPEELAVEQFGHSKAGPERWASCIRVISPIHGETLHLEDLDDNEAAFCISFCIFQSSLTTTHIVVGTASNVNLSSSSFTEGYLRVYKLAPDGTSLEFLHKTPIKGIPKVMCSFQGRLLVGVGSLLRIYDLGKKKMLRKCECKGFPTTIVTLHTQGNRIILGDAQESVHYAMYRAFDNRIVIFADDTIPRWVTATCMVDYDTVVGGDKMGNIFVNRLSAEVSKGIDEDTTGNQAIFDRGYLQGAPHKVHHEADFFLGETLTSLTKTSLVPGGREILLYTTLMGGIGLLIPFISKDDVDFFQTLEMTMRSECPPLCGRDHLAYRSFYTPVHAIIDGDLCEMFNVMVGDKKRGIAESVDRSVADVGKKLEDMRTRVAF
ncbi:pre-mRNA-splicing factor rse1 [Batrachochytrium dendrobatidis]|nr:pre-mRNA-splicing factor rse1 [Batrachochytrium dendrobatidis]KAK5664508.1 pre-mRNA-splicing factor rse1 [Batrachochytrium dendrobatidis]